MHQLPFVVSEWPPADPGNDVEREGSLAWRRKALRPPIPRGLQAAALLESAADLIVLLDETGKVLYASASAAALTGTAKQELEQLACFDFVHEDDHPTLEALRSSAHRPGSTARAELRVRAAGGEWRTLDAIARNLLHDADVGGILVVARDVTKRKALEDQLRHSQKMEAVGRLAGGIAHDFNNLLTVIDLQTEFLADSMSMEDPRRAEVDEIRRASRHGAALTRQLLAFGRRQANQPRVLDVNRLVRDMERMLRRVLGDDIRWHMELAQDAGTIHMDPAHLEQVLLNLVVNARDAMPAGGSIFIRTVEGGCSREGPCAPEARCVCIEVRDTGLGMDAATRERVFEPFFTTKPSGTGLGLSTVYGIVNQAGGCVELESEPGEGTTFRLRFPWAGPALEQAVSVRPGWEPEGGSETILLVDDDSGLRRSTRRLLTSLGYRVLAAPSGAAALDLVEAHEEAIHLLLTDVVMPGMGGPELAQRLRQARPDTAVLFFSGYDGASPIDGETLEGLGALLLKPFTCAELADAVREALGTAAVNRGARAPGLGAGRGPRGCRR
jgi:two-component system, cell cycle sensor histidine kinase and response regulator CckA